uniref:Uncharacterized protein n=1 Tax=Pipistrellus kuhlii TaxID=59472 RepID=A0A7J7S677_PIPKU|nr:hypothetical protein mPipKuh1_010029 [Pipistrellus kuhlii]
MRILGRSFNLSISSLGLCPPIPAACLALGTLLFTGRPVGTGFCPSAEGRGPVSSFPQLGVPRSSRPPRSAGLPPPVRLRPPLRRPLPQHPASLSPGRTVLPLPGERKKEGNRDANINAERITDWLPPARPQLGMESKTAAPALTELEQ